MLVFIAATITVVTAHVPDVNAPCLEFGQQGSVFNYTVQVCCDPRLVKHYINYDVNSGMIMWECLVSPKSSLSSAIEQTMIFRVMIMKHAYLIDSTAALKINSSSWGFSQ